MPRHRNSPKPRSQNNCRYQFRNHHQILREQAMTHKFFNENISTMDPRILYKILQIRTDVFVVEQNCPYPELDGRDLEPDSEQLWVTVDDEVAGTIRILRDADALRIGRVVVAAKHRGTGVARELFEIGRASCREE